MNKKKIKPKHKLPKKTRGGALEDMSDIANSLSPFTGPYGAAVGAAASAINAMNSQLQKNNAGNTRNIQEDINPYMRDGGRIPHNFTQYDLPSHEFGGGAIDAEGKVTKRNAVAEVEKKENTYNFEDKNFVFSDSLINPETDNTFAKDASKITKKYKNSDTIPEQRKAMEFELKRLSQTNELLSAAQEHLEGMMKYGGKLKQYRPGGVIPSPDTFMDDFENTLQSMDNMPRHETLYSLPINKGGRPSVPNIPIENPVTPNIPILTNVKSLPIEKQYNDSDPFASKETRHRIGAFMKAPDTSTEPSEEYDPFGRGVPDALQDVQLYQTLFDAMRPRTRTPNRYADTSRTRSELDRLAPMDSDVVADQIARSASASHQAASGLRSTPAAMATRMGIDANTQAAISEALNRMKMVDNQAAGVRGQAEMQLADSDRQARVVGDDIRALEEASQLELSRDVGRAFADMGTRESLRNLRKDQAVNARELAMMDTAQTSRFLTAIAPDISSKEWTSKIAELQGETDPKKREKLIQDLLTIAGK